MFETIHKLLHAAGYKFLATWLAWLSMPLLLALVERLSTPPNAMDRYLLNLAYKFRSFELDQFFALITWGGSLLFLTPVTALIAAILINNGRCGAAWLLALSLAGAGVFSRLAKLWFARPRPDCFPVVGTIPGDYSYPSAHSAQILALVLALGWVLRAEKLGLRYFALMGSSGLLLMLVAVSRIYLQVHYPSDVVGGAIIAVLWFVGLFNALQCFGMFMR